MVITEYKGMTVAEISGLREELRGSEVEYKVVKNTLARLAAEDTPVAVATDHFKGPVAVALGYDDPIRVAKSIFDFAKKNQKLKVTGGVVEGTFYGPEDLKALAELPPREVLLGMLAGAMQAPAAKMARLFSATVARFGYALNALKVKKAAEGG
jgi:large subunit ribosomal protein L10